MSVSFLILSEFAVIFHSHWSLDKNKLSRFSRFKTSYFLNSLCGIIAFCPVIVRLSQIYQSSFSTPSSLVHQVESETQRMQMPISIFQLNWITMMSYGLPQWLSGKESVCSAGGTGNLGLVPGSGRSPEEGNGNPLQYSCLQSPRDGAPGTSQFIRLQRIGYEWSDWAQTESHNEYLLFLRGPNTQVTLKKLKLNGSMKTYKTF